MQNWDKDIHRIQEIHKLLEDRQRYFCEHLNTSCYKLDRNGNTSFLPKLQTTTKRSNSNEPSLGHSVEANFGSTTDCDSNIPTVNSLLKEEGIMEPGNVEHSDSSEGNHADLSQDESSGADDHSGTRRNNGKKVTKKKVMRKSPKVLRKWVDKNLKVAAAPFAHRKSNANTIDFMDSQKSSILRFKSVSFDGDSVEGSTELLNEVDYEYSENTLSPTQASKIKKQPNPINLLRRRSWVLKAEITSRLNDNTKGMNLNKVVTGLTKKSISHARERLKKAEKSLRATVKNEHKMSSFKTQVAPKTTEMKSKNTISSTVPKYKPLSNSSAQSKLALRRQEEALRSDLNLREAFALIKINPDPLLDLASVENDPKKKVLLNREPTIDKRNEGKFGRKPTIDDSKTTQSLQRLTKLSIQHLQKQQSLIPSIAQSIQIPTGKKEIQTLRKSTLKSQRVKDFEPNDMSRRKSSTTSTSSGQLKMQPRFHKERRVSKFAVQGKPLKERRPSKLGERLDVDANTLERLSGTVI